MDIESIKSKVNNFNNFSVLIIGDIVLDEFMYTEVKRISREAPVFICQYQKSDLYPGCGGNTLNNVVSLSGNVKVAGVLGKDSEGEKIKWQFIENQVDCTYLNLSEKTSTMKKTRILAGGVHRAKQHMLRVDKEFDMTDLLNMKHVIKAVEQVDGIIISDYGYNTVTPESVTELIEKANILNKPVFIDSRYRCHLFNNVKAITPNEEEAELILGRKIPESGEELLSALNEIAQICKTELVLLTRGSNGLVTYSKVENSYTYFNVYGSEEAVDVSGAGDSVIAAFALSVVSGLDYIQSAFVANVSGGISVMKKGTYSVLKDELIEGLNDENLEKGITLKGN